MNIHILLTLFLIWIAHFLVDVMLGIWPVYKTMVEFDLKIAGLIVAIGAFIGEGSQLLFGSLSDRGFRKAIMIFGFVAAASAAFLPYFTHYGSLFGLYLLVCIGSGAFHPAAAGFVNSLIPQRRGLLMTIFASGGSLGLAFSQLIFSYINENFSGKSFWLALPVLGLFPFMLFYRFPKNSISSSHKIDLKDFISFFKRQDLSALYLTLVANQAILWGTIFILPDVLKALGHTEWACYGGGHMCLILGGALMMVPSGYLADKYSAHRVIFYASILSGIAFYTFLFLSHFSHVIPLISLFILGASLAVVHPVGVSLGARLVPDKPSTVSAFLMGMVWCISEVLGPGSVGWISSFFTDDATVKALAILGCLFLVNFYAILCIPKENPSVAVQI